MRQLIEQHICPHPHHTRLQSRAGPVQGRGAVPAVRAAPPAVRAAGVRGPALRGGRKPHGGPEERPGKRGRGRRVPGGRAIQVREVEWGLGSV